MEFKELLGLGVGGELVNLKRGGKATIISATGRCVAAQVTEGRYLRVGAILNFYPWEEGSYPDWDIAQDSAV